MSVILLSPDMDPLPFKVAAVVARQMLERKLESFGASPIDAANLADTIVAMLDTVDGSGGVSPEQVDALSQVIADRIVELDGLSPTWRAFIDECVTAAQALPLSAREPDGASRRLVLVALLVFALDTNFTLKSSGEWEVSNNPLLETLVPRILDTVDRGIEAARQVLLKENQKKDGPLGDEGSTTSPAGMVPSKFTEDTSHILGRTMGKSNRTDGDIAVSRLVPKKFFKDECFYVDEKKNSAIRSLDAAQFLSETVFTQLNSYKDHIDERDIEDWGKGKPSWTREDSDHPISFDVGLIPIAAPDRNAAAYRLAVRVQFRQNFKNSSWRMVREKLDRALHGLARIRNIREISHLIPSEKVTGLRHRGAKMPVTCGAGISTNFASEGTIGPFATDGTRYFAITAGHVLARDGTGAVGDRAYSPPYSDPTDQSIGTIAEASLITQPWSARRDPDPALDRPDFCAVHLDDPGRISPTRRRDSGVDFEAGTFPIDLTDPGLTGLEVRKGSAIKSAMEGRVTAVGVRSIITSPLTARSVVSQGLIEIELDKGKVVAPGESGVMVVDRRTRHVIGIVVAGTDEAWLSDHGRRAAVYVQPLHAIMTERNWRIY